MSDRETYFVDKGSVSRAEAQLIWSAVVDVLRPRLRRATVDALTDHADELTDEDRLALSVLVARGRRRRLDWIEDASTAIPVSLEDPEWIAVEQFAPRSVDVELFGEGDTHLASLQDSGRRVLVKLTAEEADQLTRRLQPVAPLISRAARQSRDCANGRDLDCTNLEQVRVRVVDPVIGSLLCPGEVDRVDLRFGPPPGLHPAFENDDPEVWLVLVAQGEQFEFRVCKATGMLWDAEDTAAWLYDALWEWLPETSFAWGQNRHGDYVIPPVDPGVQ